MSIEAQIKKVFVAHPSLGNEGFMAMYKGLSDDEYNEKLAKGQQYILDHAEDQVVYAMAWLSDVKKTKTMNRKHSSYRLKHIAEPDSPNHYIVNGAFIVAAILSGFAFEQCGQSAYFNMSWPSISGKYSS